MGRRDRTSHPLLRVFAALDHRDFRVLWFGAFTSSIGTWMQKVAQNWLVLTLTGSAFFLGLDAFLGELPILLFILIGGVVADRRDRRQLLLMSQCTQMVAAFALGLLLYFGVVRIWHVLLLSFITGCAQAFGGPAYQSLIPSLVTKDALPNAIAFNSIQFNLARAIGPLIAGVALGIVGYAGAFGLNGLSFLFVIASILSLRVKHIPAVSGQRIFDELKSGLSYVRHEPSLLTLTVLGLATTFLAIPLSTLMPVMARQVFQEGFGPYSRLMTSFGAGAVVGALIVAWLGRFRHMGTAVLVVQIVLGGLIVSFAASRLLWLSYPLLFGCGMAQMIVLSMMTSLVQLIAPNEMRGRVMSIYMVAFRGGMPLGSLVAGYLANLSSATAVLALNGALLMTLAASLMVTNHDIRRI
ncbi:MAG: MFS transporter [Acidobacteria bacterium]|nr:MFS transporter [Acidobacteriota bacterium]